VEAQAAGRHHDLGGTGQSMQGPPSGTVRTIPARIRCLELVGLADGAHGRLVLARDRARHSPERTRWMQRCTRRGLGMSGWTRRPSSWARDCSSARGSGPGGDAHGTGVSRSAVEERVQPRDPPQSRGRSRRASLDAPVHEDELDVPVDRQGPDEPQFSPGRTPSRRPVEGRSTSRPDWWLSCGLSQPPEGLADVVDLRAVPSNQAETASRQP